MVVMVIALLVIVVKMLLVLCQGVPSLVEVCEVVKKSQCP